MRRRDFLTWAAASGLGLVCPPIRRASAERRRFEGPFWMTIQAEGGWDPTSLCDPKGGRPRDRDSINQTYNPDQIERAGELSYAPIALSMEGEGGQPVEVYSARAFFAAHAHRFLVVNGIDTSTNNHETGKRVVWSGFPAEGYPSISALAAAAAFRTDPLPMAFVSYGGYDVTANSVPLTRASNVDELRRIAFPNRINPRKRDSPGFYTEATADRIAQAEAARTRRLLSEEPMPVMRRALRSLLAVRAGESGLAALSEYLPSSLVSLQDLPEARSLAVDQRGKLNELQNLMRQGQLALAAFRAGVGVSANLVIGGFDTHADHDRQHLPRLVQLLRGVDYICTQAHAQGLADRLFVIVASDFGRTPYYNAGNGKDHWALTSMLLSGPGIAGGRVIGGTDAAFRPLTFDPSTLRPSSTGIRLHPQHVHHALRKLGGFDSGALASRFPLPDHTLPFFA